MTAWLAQGLRHFLLAVQFFTRIPITGALAQWVGFSPALLRASVAHFPAMGLLVGGVAAAAAGLCLAVLPDTAHTPLVAAVLSTVATVMLTGGFHEDGLADVTDGLGGSHLRERALEIMKDSRVGAFGAMALVLVLLTKVALLAALLGLNAQAALGLMVLAHVSSRTWPMLTIALLPHVGDAAGSKSKPLADQASPQALVTGFLWLFMTLSIAAYAFSATHYATIGWGLAGGGLAWLYTTRLLKRRLGGFTGDGLGATQQLCEAAFLLGALAACR
jgi:adenosylcobinamide-GDP ribazoletransferase